MNEEPKSVWKKSLRGRTAFVIWLAIFIFAFMLACFLVALADADKPVISSFFTCGVIAGFALATILFVLYIVWPLLRFLFWKHWRQTLFGLACLATLVGLFYAEENWRGKHDWEKFKREWEAKGEKFDWQSIIPPPVPDDQNFALTPIVASSYETYFDKNGKNLYPRNTNVVDRMSMLSWRDNPWTSAPNFSDTDWAKSQFIDLKPWQNYFRSAPPPDSVWARTNKNSFFPTSPQPQSPAADVLLALSKYDSAIEELREAGKLPCSRFPLEYNEGMPAAILLPHLADLKRCSKALQLHAVAELQNGGNEKALDDIKLMVRLENSIRTEPFLISHLVRIAILHLALQPVYEGLAEHKWSEAQLTELDSELSQFDFVADYKFSIRGERGLEIANIEFLRHPHGGQLFKRPRFFIAPLFYILNEFSSFSDDNKLGKFQLFALSAGPSGWLFQNEKRIAEFEVKWWLPVAHEEQNSFSPELVRAADKAIRSETKHCTPENVLEAFMLPGFGSAATKYAYAQSAVNLARTAIALERFRLARGNFPDSLAALAPRFLEKIPHDVIGGQPLHYRLEADGNFILYSVGWNETDDGGVVVFKKNSDPRDEMKADIDFERGDWVWRYPQK